jgi:tetratricopeptide (TPR) repeat protein
MDSQRLREIQRKVEEGERLTSDELGALGEAGRREGGVSLKLALAHALSNAEEDEAALALLSRLRKDYPKDVSVQLGYARALVGLERYEEANAVLLRALAQRPDDPEVLKALSLLALRRGEVAKAVLRVEHALSIDPLDVEARLIREELGSAELPPSSRACERALRPQFVARLSLALEERRVETLLRGSELWIRVGREQVGRVDVASLYATYLEEGVGLDDAVNAMAEELTAASELPKSREELLSRVWPVLRPFEFTTKATQSAHREGPGGLFVFYVLHDPELVRYVPKGALPGLDVSLSELDERAWRQLGLSPAVPRPVIVDRGEPRLSPQVLGLWALCEADGYDAARLLCPEQAGVLRAHVGEGPYRVALGRRELVLLCQEHDAAAARMLEGLTPAAEGIPGRFRLHEGRLASMAGGT